MAKPKITRIKAGETKPAKLTAPSAPVAKTSKKPKNKLFPVKIFKSRPNPNKSRKPFLLFRPFIALGHYLRASWQELRQVRWPNRKATWKMVLAVIIYTVFFATILILLDLFFSFIFKKLLG